MLHAARQLRSWLIFDVRQSMQIYFVSILGLVLTTLLASCASIQSGARVSSASDADFAREITAVSQACAEAWNRGDLHAYLAPYSHDVVVVYKSGPEKGRTLLEARLRKAQRWDGQRPRNLARIGYSEASRIGDDHALQTAQVIIQESTGEVQLWITSILMKNAGSWVVVHEQSF
jgi:uncharacterized protein (TIGR02246 family)